MADKQFDVAVLGASGFTGQQAVRALVRQAATRRCAGRSPGATPTSCARPSPSMCRPARPQPGVVVADTNDLDALASLAAVDTRVAQSRGPLCVDRRGGGAGLHRATARTTSTSAARPSGCGN